MSLDRDVATNFKARIVADVLRDNGEETTHSFEIEAQFCVPDARPHRFAIPASRFPGLGWIHDKLGARAVLYPGYAIKDHPRVAIQLLSDDIGFRRVFTHTGWRKFPRGWYYLHGGGAIGETGSISDVEVDLPPQLQAFVLPSPLDVHDLSRAVNASLAILDLAPDHITVPVLCAIYCAVVRPSDFSLHLTGRTSTFKTEMATLAQQHFGSSFNARNLPGSWSSTGNALEILAFTAKDALLVVDDFAPQGTAFDVARLHREADRLLRAQGNRSGRGRLRPDRSPRPVKAPRGRLMAFTVIRTDVPNQPRRTPGSAVESTQGSPTLSDGSWGRGMCVFWRQRRRPRVWTCSDRTNPPNGRAPLSPSQGET